MYGAGAVVGPHGTCPCKQSCHAVFQRSFGGFCRSSGLSRPFAHDMPLSWDILGAELVLVDPLSLFVTLRTTKRSSFVTGTAHGQV